MIIAPDKNPSDAAARLQGAAQDKVVGKYLTYPDMEGKRLGEGGLRLQSKVKQGGQDKPLVSIITVCYNAAGTLEQCMRSVFGQTYSNIEYIVVDGGSTDSTLELLSRHQDMIDYYVSEPDRGLYHAMNKGLELASGDYILMLNADDWYAANAVHKLLAAKRYAGTGFVSALAQAVDQDGAELKVMLSMPYDNSVRMRMPLRHETMLISAAIYDAIGNYDESYPIIADYDLAIRLFEAGYTHYEVPQPLLYFRNTGVSNANMQGVIAERIQLLGKQFPFLHKDELALLADRDHHTGQQLLAIADKHAGQPALVGSLFAYIAANASVGMQGIGRAQWKIGGAELLTALHERRLARSPQISVILPVFNAEQTLAACIDSVLAQSFNNFELICINDQTPDGSQAIIDKYCGQDNRIRSMINPENIGLGASRNRGVRSARGAYIFHIDPDDTIPPNAFKILHRQAALHNSELVRGAYLREQFHHASSKFLPEVKYALGHKKTVVNACAAELPELLRTPEGHWAFLYRAELARRVPYPEDLKMGQDGIFLCCVLPAATSITVIPDVVYNYLVNAASAMNVFSFRKYMDVLEWRRRAFHILDDAGLRELGVRLVRSHAHLPWHDQFSRHYVATQSTEELSALGTALRTAYAEAGLNIIDEKALPQRRRFLQALLDNRQEQAAALLTGNPESQGTDGSIAAPKVSIILPFFKAERTLRNSLDSVLAQTLGEFELICINDVSPDGSQAIVDEYAKRDPRIICIRNEVNIGHGASRNRGVAEARGEYIFHLDPDDSIPPTALAKLHASAIKYGSEMTKGAYLHEQYAFGEAGRKSTRRGLPEGSPNIANTTLAQTPDLLRTTEGHWSYLYKSEFAKRVFYPTDLKMGQDSIFIVGALTQAKSVSVTNDIVYHYHANPDSAMNTFTFRKYMDALEWRRRAWHVLKEAGQKEIGDRLLQVYWSDAFFRNLAASVKQDQAREFFAKFRLAFSGAGITHALTAKPSQFLEQLFPHILSSRDSVALNLMSAPVGQKLAVDRPNNAIGETADSEPTGIKVATFVSRDVGGAATGTQRRVAALRQNGINARIYSLVVNSKHAYVKRIVPTLSGIDTLDQNAVWAEVRRQATKSIVDLPGYRATELFSLHHSVLDFRQMTDVFDDADVVHMHWVMGMFDYVNAGTVLADKPLTWTLADMNAFTGGCHYSEGCEEFKRECRSCSLLGGESDLAHQTWRAKKAAYDQLRNLHIICPSKWMADLARSSSLLGDKTIHYIPNAFPTSTFYPTNKTVARIKLGLPVDKKLLLFGAENQNNKRKGGKHLQEVFQLLQQENKLADIEIIVFGKNSLNLPVRTHNLGHINYDRRLVLAYSAADAYLFPSLEDNAPLTVGEALLCGTPVVAHPVGNIPELLVHKDTGYIARRLDVADFALGVEWALNSGREDALRRSIACRTAAADFHNPTLAAGRHLSVYQEAMGRAQPSPQG